MGRDCLRWNSFQSVYYGEGCVGSAVGGASVGTSVGTSVGASVGTSVGGIAVNVGATVFVGKGNGVFVEMRAGVTVGNAVLVAANVLAARSEFVVDALTEGFVPQSLIAFIQLVTSLCSTAGSQALKKS